MVELAHRAAKQARTLLFKQGLSEPAALRVSSLALRVYSLARRGRCVEATAIADVLPRLSRVWAGGQGTPQELLQLFRRWSEEAVVLRTAELEGRDLPEEDKRARRSQLRRYHERIRLSRRRHNAVAWYSCDGVPLPDLAAVGAEIKAYWGEVFTAPALGDIADEEFLSHVQTAPPPEWSWVAGRTREISAAIRDSAPGPDGPPYAWWATAPDSFHELLDEIAQQMQRGQLAPEAIRDSVAVAPPKADILDDAGATRCAADIVRPITLMQCGSKLIAVPLSVHLGDVARTTVASPEQGFVAGRRIEECLIGFDGACVVASWRAEGGAAGLLLDFAQAFPSLSHRWLFLVMERMQLPPEPVRIARSLYLCNTTTFEVAGAPVAVVMLASGIRQGCPLTGSLFALALDPLGGSLRTAPSPARGFSLMRTTSRSSSRSCAGVYRTLLH